VFFQNIVASVCAHARKLALGCLFLYNFVFVWFALTNLLVVIMTVFEKKLMEQMDINGTNGMEMKKHSKKGRRPNRF
jgi:hypothetical protein